MQTSSARGSVSERHSALYSYGFDGCYTYDKLDYTLNLGLRPPPMAQRTRGGGCMTPGETRDLPRLAESSQ